MKPTDTLDHLFVLIIIISVGILVTSCVNWTPAEYMDSPIEQPLIDDTPSYAMEPVQGYDCFVGSPMDECVDFQEVDDLLEPVCNMDLCT